MSLLMVIFWVGCSKWVDRFAGNNLHFILLNQLWTRFHFAFYFSGNSHSSRWNFMGNFGNVGDHWNDIRPFTAEFHRMLVGCIDFGCADMQWAWHLVWFENLQNARNARIQMGQHSWYFHNNWPNKACRPAIHARRLDDSAMAESKFNVYAIFIGVTVGDILAGHRTEYILFEAYFRNATIASDCLNSLDIYRIDCRAVG